MTRVPFGHTLKFLKKTRPRTGDAINKTKYIDRNNFANHLNTLIKNQNKYR